MLDNIMNFVDGMGFWSLDWKHFVMYAAAIVLLYLAIKKGFEPLLLVPIALGAFLTNLPMSGLLAAPFDLAEQIAQGIGYDRLAELAEQNSESVGGLFYYISQGVHLDIFPPLIFLGIGAMTDFSPLLANPKTFLLGAAAQIGVFGAVLLAVMLGFDIEAAAAIGIIGGADGPTAIFLSSKLAPELMGPIAVAAYSYMALVPLIQPPIMKALTTDKERKVVMEPPRNVSKRIRIIFPIAVTAFGILIVPPSAPLLAMLMGGNLLKESGVVERLSKMAQNELINIVTFFLGVSVGMTMTAESFLQFETLKILGLGVIAFCMSTIGGVFLGKLMYAATGGKVNPLIGSAGVSAVPMAARVSHVVGQEYDKSNFLLMHAMGPNVAGVVGTAICAGFLLSVLG